MARGTYRVALGQRDFRLLVSALSQSSMGDWAYNVALIVYVYNATSAAWVAAGTLGRMIPRFFASLYAGVLAERYERVRVMVTADATRAVLMAGMAVATALHAPPAVVIALAGLIAVFGSVYDPATAAMLPQLLGEDNLAAGNALTETVNNVAIVVGPAVGALVLLVGSPSVVMALDALTFCRIRCSRGPDEGAQRSDRCHCRGWPDGRSWSAFRAITVRGALPFWSASRFSRPLSTEPTLFFLSS